MPIIFKVFSENIDNFSVFHDSIELCIFIQCLVYYYFNTLNH